MNRLLLPLLFLVSVVAAQTPAPATAAPESTQAPRPAPTVVGAPIVTTTATPLFRPKVIMRQEIILPKDPFQTLDQEGIGQLIQIGTERGRRTRGNLKVGICGEHGGDPDSIAFCHRVGMDYVSCSPYRVPIARLAAAQAALRR